MTIESNSAGDGPPPGRQDRPPHCQEPAGQQQGPCAADGPARLTRTATFADPALESAYRTRHAVADRRTARVSIVVAAIGAVVFVTSDYRLFGTGRELYTLLAARVGVVAVSILAWLRLRRPLSAATYDRTMLVWGLAAVAQILYVTSTRPPTYAGHAVVNLSAVLLTYTIIPLPLLIQVALAGSLSLGCALLAAGDGLGATAVGWSFLGANVLGIFVSRRLHRQGREMFAANARLGQALAEVRTLRGMIKVCAWCRKVAVEGRWQQLEAYVRDHTHAEFTHGICPTCRVEAEQDHPV